MVCRLLLAELAMPAVAALAPHYPYPPSCQSNAGNEDVPANYGHFQGLPDVAATDIQVDHMWTTIPSVAESQGNGIFSSTQYAFQNGATAYCGTQVMRAGMRDSLGRVVEQGETTKVIFSVWDTYGKPRWSGANCGPFGGEGTGAHCLMTYPLQENRKYTITVQKTGNDGSADYWEGSVTDLATGQKTVIGTLIHPNSQGFEGFGDLAVGHGNAAFQEWFVATGCYNQAVGGVGQYGPFFNRRSVSPSGLQASYKRNNCFTSDTNACVPGDGCGYPRLFMVGGGNTARTTRDGQDLWTDTPTPVPTPTPSPSPTPGGVNCGAHREPTCAECPQGHGAAWCNGDCHWQSGGCVPRASAVV